MNTEEALCSYIDSLLRANKELAIAHSDSVDALRNKGLFEQQIETASAALAKTQKQLDISEMSLAQAKAEIERLLKDHAAEVCEARADVDRLQGLLSMKNTNSQARWFQRLNITSVSRARTQREFVATAAADRDAAMDEVNNLRDQLKEAHAEIERLTKTNAVRDELNDQ